MKLRLAEIFRGLLDERAAVAVRAYDETTAGPRDAAAVLEVRGPEAVRYLVTAPGELGLARAYVTGALEVRGDLHAALHALLAPERTGVRRGDLRRLPARFGLSALRRPPVPAEEVPPPWRRGLARHTRRRDAAAIGHHYDVSNRFYELVLGASMTYSCAVFTTPDATLDEAQSEKLDLVCRKLDLRPGRRLLDVGAGWGAMVRHAAEHHGAHALGVTLSPAQAAWARRAIDDAGLAGRAEVRLLDYRDLPAGEFDAISSIGAMEHFGTKELASYFASMAARLRPGGRMLNHSITRPSGRERHRAGPFVDRYVFPDGELQSAATVIGAMQDNGLELRHEESLREHYAMTLREWGANLDRHWSQAVAEVGERRARVWRLYMAAARISFELDGLEVHQVLGVRVGSDGRSHMPPRPSWERGEADRLVA